MRFVRTWVLPSLRLLVFAAIAVALVKLAFFPDASSMSAEEPAVPTGQVTDPVVAVKSGTVRNDVTVTGSVQADAAAPVRATAAGTIASIAVKAGDSVAADTVVARITTETPNPDGTVAKKTTVIKAGSAGTLSDLPVLVGQSVSVGDTLGQVAPPTFSVVASLAPEAQYRLVNKPTEGSVLVTGGPAAFTCTNLAITTPLAGAGTSGGSAAGSGSGSGGDGSASGSGSGSGTTVSCRVPGDVQVFAGLSAQLTMAGGVAENALVLPLTAVEGANGSGAVYMPASDGGDPTKVPVQLGLTDGKKVQITGGVKEGDEVLEFVPTAPGATSTSGASASGCADGASSCGG